MKYFDSRLDGPNKWCSSDATVWSDDHLTANIIALIMFISSNNIN